MSARLGALIGAALVVCTGDLRAQGAKADAPQPLVRGYPTSPVVSMRAYVPAGHVRVRVWDRDSVHIAGTIGAASSYFGGGAHDFVKLGVEPLRTGDTRLPDADLVVTIPRRARLWVKTITGTIETDGTAGELELYTIGGSVVVRRASGVVSAETIDAPITVESSRGDLRVRGGKGVVMLRDVTGTATIATVSGGVTVVGSAPECRVETIGGDITWRAPRLRGVTVELQTHSGAIALALDPAHLPHVDAASRAGKTQRTVQGGAVTEGRITARSFRGVIRVDAMHP